ncbi:Small subunit processome component [Ascosphaera acerosa]|nr:Small subunit processome component [Ascosphaera acerosa]
MRAKRSKKYRKLMQQYEIAFGFREPYQVLVDSHFLKAVHAFRMDFMPALERTLQGKPKPFITKCSLHALTATAKADPSTAANADSRTHPSRAARPPELPPPTVLPLRYCSHNENDEPIDEAECLLNLLSPNRHSTDAKKINKEHYILATADPIPPKHANKARPDRRKEAEYAALQRKASQFRWQARQVPGVPIIYVKRSVMILEPLSGGSERVREGVERDKLREGLKVKSTPGSGSAAPGTGLTASLSDVGGKRKREETQSGATDRPKKRAAKKVKGPNPLSVKKPKKRPQDQKKRAGKPKPAEPTQPQPQSQPQSQPQPQPQE